MKQLIKFLLKKFDIEQEIIYFYNRISCFWKSDEEYYRRAYRKQFNRELNLKNPETFNEKVIKRILFDKKEIYSRLADKYLVREYVRGKIGEGYLIPMYNFYNSIREIEIEKLPEKFVLKCTHDCKSVFICDDKSKFDFKKMKRKISFYLKRNFYYQTREWQYKNIVPRIICEEKLTDTTDFKFHCFNGKVNHVEVIYDRFDDERINLYDKNWKLLPIKISACNNFDETYLSKPQNFDEMVKVAEKLSEDFNYCRVDLYNDKGNIRFGEITFTPAMGLDQLPEEFDLYLGSLWKE